MEDLSPPLHIDFVITNKSEPRGYWFITWIRGPGNITIWRKTLRGNWQLEVPKYVRGDIFANAFVDYKRDVFAIGPLENYLNQLLFEHMTEKEFPYEAPYKYWRDPGDPVQIDITDGPGL
jgi:hypothetical protein